MVLWQCSWTGKIDGINGNVDLDFCYDNTLFSKTSIKTADKSDDLTDNTVYAFYRPNWAAANSSTETNTTTKKTSHTISQIASATNVDFSVKVTSSNGVNIRNGASTSYDVLGAVPYGAVLTVTKQTSGGGYTWGLITYNGVTGWIALNYTEKVTSGNIKKGSIVTVKSGSVDYDSKLTLASFVYNSRFTVMELSGSRAVIGIDGRVTAAVDVKYLTLVK